MKPTIGRLGILVLVLAPMVLAGSLLTDSGVATAVVGAGGGKASATDFAASITVGQAVAARGVSSSAHRIKTGFWETVDPEPPMGVGDDVVGAFPDQLQNCAPNPFNPATTIRFSLSRTADVRIDIYDLRGRRVARLLDETREPGFHTLDYRPTNLASGVYVLEMRAGSFRDTRRMVLLK